jgi:hypothetical protein
LFASHDGDVVIRGLVDASYKGGVAAAIEIASFGGSVTIDGNSLLEIEAGSGRPVTSGVTVRWLRDPVAGTINIRAQEDITVIVNRVLNTNPAQINYGAVAVKLNSTNGRGGKGDVVVISHEGRIIASDRAFDFENRFDELNAITLLAKGNIELSVTDSINADTSNNAESVVSTRGGDSGQGGTNRLRSYTGRIVVGTDAKVLSDFVGRQGSNGTNALTSCAGVTNNGTVTPSDANVADDSGVCAPDAPSMVNGPIIGSKQ